MSRVKPHFHLWITDLLCFCCLGVVQCPWLCVPKGPSLHRRGAKRFRLYAARPDLCVCRFIVVFFVFFVFFFVCVYMTYRLCWSLLFFLAFLFLSPLLHSSFLFFVSSRLVLGSSCQFTFGLGPGLKATVSVDQLSSLLGRRSSHSLQRYTIALDSNQVGFCAFVGFDLSRVKPHFHL